MPTILVIDDEEPTRHLARLMLEQKGYSVLEEEDAQAGITTARRQLPDLILMDISMPSLDGWTATRVIKSDPAMAHIPIVAWTAMNIGGESGARAAGYDGYLPKPVDLNLFVGKVASLLPARPREPETPSFATQKLAAARSSAAISDEAMAEAHLLLLTNDESTRQQICQCLDSQGYRHIIPMADAAAAFKAVDAHHPDLILLDLDIAGAGSLELLRRLRSDARLETAPVIVVTDSRTAQSGALRELGLDADDCLSKPVDKDMLTAYVSSRLRIKLLEDNVRRRQTELEVLYRAGQVLSASIDPSTVLALILEQASAAVEAAQGSLYILDADCRPAKQLHTSGVLDMPQAKQETLFERGAASWICGLLEPMLIENTPDHPHWLRIEGDTRTQSSLAVPLIGREGVMGVLLLDHDEAGHFTQEHIKWLMALAARAAVALDNARLFENVRNERKKLSAILDSSADAILVTDETMRIALINKAAVQTLGLHVSEIGHPIREALPHNPLVELLDFAALRGELVSLEVALDNATYHATVRPVEDIGYVVALHDISLLKELEQMELERERQETERVRREFARHVSPQVADLLLKRGESLGALRKCNAAMLFSDLRNYTALTERIGIEAIMEYVLKRYLTVMTDMIYAHEGTINKILGDGIMAVFGVPIPQNNAPQRVMRTALAMQRALAMLREGWLHDLDQDISMGIGLAWGEVIAGDIGGPSQRVDYTVIGDAVNLAARLGEIAAPGEVLLSQALAEVVGGDSDEWRLVELPPVMIKGKEHPQRIYRAMQVAPVG